MSRSLSDEIQATLPGLPATDAAPDLALYARDLWPRHHLAVKDGAIAEHRPGLVVWPRSPEEVATLVRHCAATGTPLVPFGAGSGVCGGILPNDRMIVCDLKRIAAVRSLDRESGVLDVEAGAMGIRLQEDLEAQGLTLGHFPSSILCSTVGGWVAARSAGQCSGRYGKIEDMVLSLECVTGTGEIVRFERRARGPDLTPLLVGSEGVLGVVTSSRLRVCPGPEARVMGAFSMPTLEAGFELMRQIYQSGLRPAVCRLYDAFDSLMARRGLERAAAAHDRPPAPRKHRPGAGAVALRTVLRAPGLLNGLIDAVGDRLLGGATLIVIFEGPEAESRDDLTRVRALAATLRAEDLGEAPAAHWLDHRYSVSYRQAPVFMSGAFSDTMEVAAPWSRLGELYNGVRRALGRHVFVMAHLSHAYPDGCSIYFTFAGPAPSRREAEARYDSAWRDALDAAVACGGTLSHHHGVGRSKAPRLGAELGLGVPIVHALRRVLDPAGILNPGNLVPRDASATRPIVPPPPLTPIVDEHSQLVHAPGSASLSTIEQAVRASGLTLAIDPAVSHDQSLAAWIGAGAPGSADPLSDPVDHLVAGFTARLASGAVLEVRPAPRRAVGPDLYGLFHGTGDRCGTIASAHVRAQAPTRARPLPHAIRLDAPVSAAESELMDRIADALRSVR